MQESESCDLITREILALKSQADANFWRLGNCLSEVSAGGLFKGCGFATFTEYLEQAVQVGRSEAFKWIQVAANFSEPLAVEFGCTKCLAFLAYIKVTPEDDRPADIARVRIPCATGEGTTLRTARECTAAQIDSATRALRTSATVAWPPGVQSLYTRLTEALPSDVRITISVRGGEAHVAFSAIAIPKLCDVIKSVAAAVPCT